MDFVFDHFWIVFIIMTFVNGLIIKYKSKAYIKHDHTLKKGYNNFLKGWLILGNIPWIIMSIGDLSGATKNIFEFFFPSDMNPIVLIFHASIIIIWMLSGWWIYFNKWNGINVD